jgi:hypothetical protein
LQAASVPRQALNQLPAARAKWEEIDWIAGFAGIPAKFAAVPQRK